MSQTVKNLLHIQETQVPSWVRKIPWRREWLPIPVSLPGEFHDGVAWWATVHGEEESYMAERLDQAALMYQKRSLALLLYLAPSKLGKDGRKDKMKEA